MAKSKKIEESTLEELSKMKRTHFGFLYVLGTLMLIYIAYFSYSLWNGTWDHGGEAIIFPVVIIGALIPSLTQISAINKEVNARSKS